MMKLFIFLLIVLLVSLFNPCTSLRPQPCGEHILLGTVEPADSSIGQSVAISGTTAVVGSNNDKAFVFAESNGEWLEAQVLVASDNIYQFGSQVAIQDNTIGVTTIYHCKVYVFYNSGSNWDEQQILVQSDPASFDAFGHSLDILGDLIVIGAISDDDSGFDTGAAYIFSRSAEGQMYSQAAKILPIDAAGNQYFGASCGLSDAYLLVSSRFSSYVFSESSPGTWVQEVKLDGSDIGGSEAFGYTSAIDGSTVVTGAMYHTHDGVYRAGAAYVFSPDAGSVWSEVTELVASDLGASNHFGSSVAINGQVIVIGAMMWQTTNGGKGVVYIFNEVDAGVWVEIAIIQNSDAAGWTRFGGHESSPSGVAMDATHVIVGAQGMFDNVGSAYIYSTEPCDCTLLGTTGWYCGGNLCENKASVYHDPVAMCNCTNINAYGVWCEKYCYNGVADEASCNCTLSGATGKFCTADVDDCASDPCLYGGTCTDFGADTFPDHNNEFNCSCSAGRYGPICYDTLCFSSPCLNSGTCENGRELACNCTSTGFEGEFCQTEIDECASSPCLNDGICTDLIASYECDCVGTGYDGLTCADDIDDCLSSPCLNGGKCKDKGANKFQCNCDGTGFEGSTCEADINDCLSSPCYNGASCVDTGVNNYTCECAVGFKGANCLQVSDTCLSSPCNNNGTCMDMNGLSYVCSCGGTGFTGDFCEYDADDCLSNPCYNGGRCIDMGTNMFTCNCTNTGYNGAMCQDIDIPDEPLDPELQTVAYTLQFSEFSSENETLDTFIENLYVILPEPLGVSASDMRIDGEYNDGYEVTVIVVVRDDQTRNIDEIQEEIEDQVVLYIDGDIKISQQVDDTEKDGVAQGVVSNMKLTMGLAFFVSFIGAYH